MTLNRIYTERLRAIADNGGFAVLTGGQRGIEKECLRIDQAGLVAQTPHPAAIGSALSNRFITTDCSEALREFVTPPEPSAWAAMQFLCDVHQFTYAAIGDEMLWPFSMPCRLRSEADIPVANYGSSNVGQMKTIYRNGLGHRYGRYMQAIAGIHFNYSLPEDYWGVRALTEPAGSELQALQSSTYLGLVRNVRRLDWLLLYLFGASPAICRSFLRGAKTDLAELDDGTCYGEWATSLRMSDLGYQNTNQSALVVSANSLDEYIRDLSQAIVTPNPDYVRLGIKRDGEYIQLNANQLQIENEYYSSVRPKRVARSGERPTHALQRGGIEYVELRSLDLSPFDPAGLGQIQQKFLEAFLIYCALEDSPPVSAEEQVRLRANHLAVARRGRQPGLELQRADGSVGLQAWAREVIAAMRPVCEFLDGPEPSGYVQVLDYQLSVVDDTALAPSARLLAELNQAGQSFADYGLAMARTYRDYFRGLAEDFNTHHDMLAREASESIIRQAEIEAADEIPLEDYLRRYYS